MPRQLRIEFPGARYHVMARGDRREAIYKDDQDRLRFLESLGEVCESFGWRMHAYVLMPNHYHLLVETPKGNLVRGMTWLQSTYTSRFNARHRLRGHVFGGRYKAIVVQHGEGNYFASLIDYLHLNPVRAKLVSVEDGLETYAWSSLSGYLASPRKRPEWLEVGDGMGGFGCRDTARGRRQFLERLEARAREEGAKKAGLTEIEGQSGQSTLRRGWYFGSQAFGEWLLGQAGEAMKGKKGNPSYRGGIMEAGEEQKAEEVVRVGLEVVGLSEEDLDRVPKADERKAFVAWEVKRRCDVRQRWIADRLKMGVNPTVSRCTVAMAERVRSDRKVKRWMREVEINLQLLSPDP